MNLKQVAHELSARLTRHFPARRDRAAARATATDRRFADDPHWRDLVLFHEYFHGDTGRGLGASHQTGWTALAASLLHDIAQDRGHRHPAERNIAHEITK